MVSHSNTRYYVDLYLRILVLTRCTKRTPTVLLLSYFDATAPRTCSTNESLQEPSAKILIGGCDNPCSSVLKRNMARLWATWGEFLSFFHSRPISTLTSRTVCLLYTHLLFLSLQSLCVVVYRSSLLPVSPTHSHPYASFVDPIWLAKSSGKLQSARRQVL